ncbi:cell division protein FtsA [Patescibacteria group bacterium]|nr:cell division protein FtsA [Patescibacteria group bacterium]
MAKNNIIIGLDVGTSKVRAIVASVKPKEEIKPKIIGIGESDSLGMRKGVVVDIEEMTKSIKRAIDQAERSSGVHIEKAYVSVGGSHIRAKTSKGIIAVSRADEEVSQDDVIRAISNASAVSMDPNREVIHVIPREFSIDGQSGIQDPRGMTGVRLEVDALIIEGLTPYIKNLRKCLSNTGVEIQGLVLDILASSNSVLLRKQKELGVLVLDLGGGTASMSVYEERKLIHINVLPIGSSHITNDIAIGLRTSIETAEKIKLEHGTCLINSVGKKEEIDLSNFDEKEEGVADRKEVVKIIEARIEEIFYLVNKELKKIDRERLLPSGAVLIGGGAKIPGIVDLAKQRLKLPVQIGNPQGFDGLADKVDDPSFATATGLIMWALEVGGNKDRFKDKTFLNLKNMFNKIKNWFKSFSP